ncbi:hypothetical protein GCM10010383_32420 [Streptomyces lomondensis]|uniref:Uncharacterized protein n=1 Tax=Streptomyces lomondensis TaxID=68229 RepID=A0ABQ2X568_9ACTN|nr:hypothetical protein GCM10010383_32420 [Streptomyces lomondensis]
MEGNSLSLLVVVVQGKRVVAQENGGEPVEIVGDVTRTEIESGRPRPRLPGVPRRGEEPLQPLDVTDPRLLGSPVQPGRVPLLKPAVHRPGTDPGVSAEPAVLGEEGRQRRYSRGDRLHLDQGRARIAPPESHQKDDQDSDLPHHRSPLRFPRRVSCY